MVSSLSPAGLVHCPAASAETALCPAHHPPAAADTGSSSSRRLKTSQTSPNLHTKHLSDLQAPTETKSGWKSEFLDKLLRVSKLSQTFHLRVADSRSRRMRNSGKEGQECAKKRVQSQEEDAGFR